MSSRATTIEGKTVLVTGANRGLGRALVEEALGRGAERAYAASRQPSAHADPRVTPLILDVTNATQIQQAVESVASLDILINNAGISLPDDLSDRAAIEQHLAVNLFGTWGGGRKWLSDRGIDFEFVYFGELPVNMSGFADFGAALLKSRAAIFFVAAWYMTAEPA